MNNIQDMIDSFKIDRGKAKQFHYSESQTIHSKKDFEVMQTLAGLFCDVYEGRITVEKLKFREDDLNFAPVDGSDLRRKEDLNWENKLNSTYVDGVGNFEERKKHD